MLIRYYDFTGAATSVKSTNGVKNRDGTVAVAGPITFTQVETNTYEAEVSGLLQSTDYRFAIDGLPEYTAILAGEALIPVYAGFTDASLYYATRLHSDVFMDLSTADKAAALVQATAAIDNLAFRHEKKYDGQYLELPRTCFNGIPPAVRYAALEQALLLADGQTVEGKTNALRVTSRRFAGVATTYASGTTPAHLEAGIISITAWKLLEPYLAVGGGVHLQRIS